MTIYSGTCPVTILRTATEADLFATSTAARERLSAHIRERLGQHMLVVTRGEDGIEMVEDVATLRADGALVEVLNAISEANATWVDPAEGGAA